MARKTREQPGIGVRGVPYYSSALRDCRVLSGLDQSQMAARLNISRVHVSRIETGARVPSSSVLTAWLSACGQPPRDDITLDVLTRAPRSTVAAQSGLSLAARVALLVAPALDEIVNIMRDEPGHAVAIQVSHLGRRRIRDVIDDVLTTAVSHAIGCARSGSAEYSAVPRPEASSVPGIVSNTEDTP